MTRKEFFTTGLSAGLCCCATPLAAVDPAAGGPVEPASPLARDKAFTDNWLADLLATMETILDEPARIRLMEGCGRGCFTRHRFKTEIAAAIAAAGGTREALLETYQRRWDAWFEGNTFHIRIRASGPTPACRCPVLRDHPAGHGAMHCHCTKGTHQAVLEAALGRPVRVEIVDTVRRGGSSCHFIADMAASDAGTRDPTGGETGAGSRPSRQEVG